MYTIKRICEDVREAQDYAGCLRHLSDVDYAQAEGRTVFIHVYKTGLETLEIVWFRVFSACTSWYDIP